MSQVQSNEWLEWICSSQSLDELRTNYDRWAETYETDVKGVWQSVPVAAALMLAEHLNDKQNTILDVGAGTGLVGAALAASGFKNIIGIDISSAMLAKASETTAYQTLVCCAIGDDRFKTLEKVSGIIATGVFAVNHAGADELSILERSIESEGIVVFTARQSFLPELQEAIARWTLLDSKVMPIYDDPICLQAYKVSNITPSFQ
ncbi:MAG: class I SAM-dependent methyltransferase [Cyanobacteria bacterium SBLK]|nr:class I SAM-dependent methyltransferase [Cyanobacteria bacterium SBLK]